MNKISGSYYKYLYVSGSRLALPKCLWYLEDFKHQGNKIKLVTKEETLDLKVIIEEALKKVEIKQLNPEVAHKALIVYIAIDRN